MVNSKLLKSTAQCFSLSLLAFLVFLLYLKFLLFLLFPTCCNLNYLGSGLKLPSMWGKIPPLKAYFTPPDKIHRIYLLHFQVVRKSK